MEGGADFGLALEDDIDVQPDARAVLDQVINALDGDRREDWHLVNLGRKVKRFYQPFYALKQAKGNALCKAHYLPDTTSAILWSRTGAREFLKSAFPVFMPIDHYVRFWNCDLDQGFALTSPLFPQTGEDSDIGAAAARNTLPRASFYQLRKQRRLWFNKLRARKNMHASVKAYRDQLPHADAESENARRSTT